MPQWTPAQAADWYAGIDWPCGFNYVPSSAVNDTEEMGQGKGFGSAAIRRETAEAGRP